MELDMAYTKNIIKYKTKNLVSPDFRTGTP